MQRRIAGSIVAVHVRTVEQQVLQVLHEPVSAGLFDQARAGVWCVCVGLVFFFGGRKGLSRAQRERTM